MKILLTNNEAITMIDTLEKMEDKRLPIRLSFLVAKNLIAMKESIYRPYKKTQEQICKTCMITDEEGRWARDNEGKLLYRDEKAFEEQLKDLLEVENEFECQEIPSELLEQCKDQYYIPTVGEITVLARFMA